MSVLNKLKSTKSLVSSIKASEKQGHEQDQRYLNYFDLKAGEKMKVLLIPDVNGELFVKFEKHGPNLVYFDKATKKTKSIPGVGAIGTYHNPSESPVMQKAFDLLNAEKETGNKTFREEAKKWFPKEYTLMSVVVLDSPVTIKPNPDGSDVKIWNVPYKVVQHIFNEVTEGNIPEDELFTTPFIIKKDTNAAGMATYENSYFSRKQIDDDELAYIETLDLTQYDYSTLDLIPKQPTLDEITEWFKKAEASYNKITGGGSVEEEEEQEEEPAPRKSSSALRDKMKANTRSSTDEEEEEDMKNLTRQSKAVKEEEEEEEEEQEEEEVESPKSSSALRDRLKNLRK